MLQQQFISFFRADLISSSMGVELNMSGLSTATAGACSNSADIVAGGRFNSWSKCSCQRWSIRCLSLMRVPTPASRMGIETAIEFAKFAKASLRAISRALAFSSAQCGRLALNCALHSLPIHQFIHQVCQPAGSHASTFNV